MKNQKAINQHKRLAMGEACEQGKYACGGVVKKDKKPVAKKQAK